MRVTSIRLFIFRSIAYLYLMKKIVALVLLIGGIAGGVYYGIEAVENTRSFSMFDSQVTVTQGNWTPVIICAVIALAGAFFYRKS